MRIALMFAISLTVLHAGVPGVSTPLPELHLNDGSILKHVEFVGFGTSTVMAKWDGGRGTIKYSDLPTTTAALLSGFKPAPSTVRIKVQQKPKTESAVAASRPSTVFGQVFVTTAGAGSYKFSGTEVGAYTSGDVAAAQSVFPSILEDLRRKNRGIIGYQLSAMAWTAAMASFSPVASVTTDADGNYTIDLPANGTFTLFVTAHRFTVAEEYHVWLVPAMPGRHDLNGSNDLF